VSPQTAGSHREDGTASVELVATVPFLLLAVLVAAQLVLVGHSLWAAGVASRAGARAALVGRDAEAAARSALPPSLRDGSTVSEGDRVAVRVLTPRLLPVLPRFALEAESALEPGSE
jgi:hypothetical protein